MQNQISTSSDKDLNEIFSGWEGKCTLTEIKTAIQGSRQDRGSSWEAFAPFSSICQLAREKEHFAADVIKRAWDGGFVSEKQAWAVAYFVKNNTCIIK